MSSNPTDSKVPKKYHGLCKKWRRVCLTRPLPDKKKYFFPIFKNHFVIFLEFFCLPSVFLCRVPDKGFAECPTKGTQQRTLCRLFLCQVVFAECRTRQSFAECIWAFAESGSVGIDIVRLAAELLTTMHYICCSFLLI